MEYHQFTFDQAFYSIQQRRFCINPHDSFIHQLKGTLDYIFVCLLGVLKLIADTCQDHKANTRTFVGYESILRAKRDSQNVDTIPADTLVSSTSTKRSCRDMDDE